MPHVDPAAKGKLFYGLYSAVVTPLTDGKVAPEKIEKYAEVLAKDGVNGVFVTGTAGMSMSLSVAERKAICEAWVKYSKKHKIEVIVHVGAQSLEDTKELAKHAEAQCVAAVSVISPSFFKPASIDLLATYMADIAAAAPKTPFLYYHFPEITGVAFPMADIFAALHPICPTLRGAKFTSTNMWDLGNTIDLGKTLGVEWDLIMGYEGQTASVLPLGVTAHIGIAFSVVGPIWNRMVRAYDANKNQQVYDEQKTGREWFKLFADICGLWQMTAATKIMLRERTGIDFGGMRLPQRDLTEKEEADLVVAWKKFQANHPNLFSNEGFLTIAPKAVVAPALKDFFSLPGASGQLHEVIKARVAAVAKALSLSEEKVYEVLPHLKASHKRTKVTPQNIASYVDHTILKPDATAKDVTKLCQEAKEHKFFAVCVNSCRVAQCTKELKGSAVQIAAVVGFPLGAMETEAKAYETTLACRLGASEIDMVLNVGQLLDGNYPAVYADIKAVVAEAVATGGATVKVIFETCLLNDEQIIDASIMSAVAGARFVKTSTGFSKGGATPEAVDIMKTVVGDACLVKASGGVRDLEAATCYIEAGTSRIGTSSGIAIVKGAKGTGY